MPVSERESSHFWEKVSIQSILECWPWTAARGGRGNLYGKFRVGNRLVYAHRLAYELMHARFVPEELVIDHLCNQPLCCNPAHMQVATIAENARAGAEVRI